MSEPAFDAPPDPVIEELRDELYTLRTLLSVSLICLIVLGLTVDRYLLKQISIENTRAQANRQLIDVLNSQFSFAKASDFWNGVVAFSKSHPDAVPLVSKYSQVIGQTVLSSPAPPPAKH